MTPAELRAAREKLGLTQSELGAALDLSKSEIWRKEAAQHVIDRRFALAMECLLRRGGVWDGDWEIDK